MLDAGLIAGLIADDSIRDSLSRFLATRKPSSGPTLPSESGVSLKGIVGDDDAKPADDLPEGRIRKVAQAVGQLVTYTGPGKVNSMSSALLVGPDLILTAGFAINESTTSAQLRMTADGKEKTYRVILPP